MKQAKALVALVLLSSFGAAFVVYDNVSLSVGAAFSGDEVPAESASASICKGRYAAVPKSGRCHWPDFSMRAYSPGLAAATGA